MHESDSTARVGSETPLARKSDRVESPQQYENWRDYAFSDGSEGDRARRS